MKDHGEYIDRLRVNRAVFQSLFETATETLIHWRKDSDSWNLIEIACHLRDEEREDFRRRVAFVLDGEEGQPPSINPPGWVKERAYSEQDYTQSYTAFLEERDRSIAYLENLENPDWDRFFDHPGLGRLDGWHFLYNWIAHDYLHQRQILRIRYDYLLEKTGRDLSYAGTWK